MYCLATDMNVLDTDHDIRWLAKMSGQQPSQRNGNRSLGEARGNALVCGASVRGHAR